ncbi:hypothetical protein [Microbacterium arborescens]
MSSGTKPIALEAAAARVGKSTRTLRRWVALGELQPVAVLKRGRARVPYFAEADVLRVDREMGARTGGRPPSSAAA